VYCTVRKTEDFMFFKGLKGTGKNVEPILCDLNKPETFDEVINVLAKEEQPLVGVFANAGVSAFAPLELMPREKADWLLQSNLFGHIELINRLLPLLRKTRQANKDIRPRILLTGSLAASNCTPYSGYCKLSRASLKHYSYCFVQKKKRFNVQSSFKDLFKSSENGIESLWNLCFSFRSGLC
jgi:NAD(P)-dependent dehydrogenase (short-subunit alcohol dehydrogenase family)